MILEEIIVRRVELPFSREFSHARKRRHSAKNIVVEVVADRGTIRGYGEGAPRPYVTGESQSTAVEGVLVFLYNIAFPWEVERVSGIWDFLEILPQGKEHNAAICALEMALLDAFGKSQGRSLMGYFDGGSLTDTITYGAAIPVAGREGIVEISTLIKNLGIQHLRVKVGGDISENRQTLELVHSILGKTNALRVDANCAWTARQAFDHLTLMKEYAVKVIEDPMDPETHDTGDFSREAGKMGITLMADESVCSFQDLERTISEGHVGMINVRLSKCGGFMKSMKIINRLREKGLSFQIGCQLGESGLLSAAGRALGLLCGDAVYYDGSYDALLLGENITSEDVCFGPGGKAGPLGGAGLGVSVDRTVLERLCNSSIRVKKPKH
jgi:muconate cycloisomerase